MSVQSFTNSWRKLGVTATVLTVFIVLIAPFTFHLLVSPRYEDMSIIIDPEHMTIALWFLVFHSLIAILTFFISKKFLNLVAKDTEPSKRIKTLAYSLYILTGVIAGLYTILIFLLLLAVFA